MAGSRATASARIGLRLAGLVLGDRRGPPGGQRGVEIVEDEVPGAVPVVSVGQEVVVIGEDVACVRDEGEACRGLRGGPAQARAGQRPVEGGLRLEIREARGKPGQRSSQACRRHDFNGAIG
jgi:hypothetical protein